MVLESVSVPGCSEQTERDPPFVLDTMFIIVITLQKKKPPLLTTVLK